MLLTTAPATKQQGMSLTRITSMVLKWKSSDGKQVLACVQRRSEEQKPISPPVIGIFNTEPRGEVQ